MLLNLREILEPAVKDNFAVGGFNVTESTMFKAIVEEAQYREAPAIIQVSPNEFQFSERELYLYFSVRLQRSRNPFVLHYDHSKSYEGCIRAIQAGFTSVMFDGSALSYEENIRQTKEAVAMARKYGVTIEAEIGKMAGITLNNEGITENRATDRKNYTDPAEAKDFVEKTGVDCLACSFGTVHGEYFSEPKLDFALVKELSEATGVPIVMHGGSGVSHEDYKKVIANGVRKINYFTYMDKAGGEGGNAAYPVKYFHDAAKAGQDAMQKDIESAMRCFVNMD